MKRPLLIFTILGTLIVLLILAGMYLSSNRDNDAEGNAVTSSTAVTVSNTTSACTLDGVTVAEGAGRIFYKAPQSPNCNAPLNIQNRTCTNGTLSGFAEFNKKGCINIPYSLRSIDNFLRPIDVRSTYRPDGNVVVDTLYPFPGYETATPRWIIGQWHSRYPIQAPTTTRTILSDGGVEYKNLGKRLVFGPGNRVIIGVNATVDRGPLIRQDGTDSGMVMSFLSVSTEGETAVAEPLVTELDSMRFTFTGRLTKLIDETPALLGRPGKAHFHPNFVITNTNPASAGYKDSMYFVIALFSSDAPHGKSKNIMIDPGTGKVLYRLAAGTYGLNSANNYYDTLASGNWITVDKEILPLVIAAIHELYNLPSSDPRKFASDNLADYTVTKRADPPHWETKDPIDIEFEYKDLDYILTRKQPASIINL